MATRKKMKSLQLRGGSWTAKNFSGGISLLVMVVALVLVIGFALDWFESKSKSGKRALELEWTPSEGNQVKTKFSFSPDHYEEVRSKRSELKSERASDKKNLDDAVENLNIYKARKAQDEACCEERGKETTEVCKDSRMDFCEAVKSLSVKIEETKGKIERLKEDIKLKDDMEARLLSNPQE